MENNLSLQETTAISEHFFNSGLFTDTKSKSQIFVKILAGQEMGLTPFVAMQSLEILMGKVFVKPYLMASLINKSQTYRYRIIEATDQRCVIDYFEIVNGKMEKMGTSTYTIEEARKAGLVRPNSGYEKNPSDMLFARAMGRGFRRFTPHLLSAPVYLEGEEWFDKDRVEVGTKDMSETAKIEAPKDVVKIEKVEQETDETEETGATEKIQEEKVKKAKPSTVIEPMKTEISNEKIEKEEYIDVRKQRIFRQTALMNGWTEDMLKLFFAEASHDNYKFTTIDKIPESEYQYLVDGLKDKNMYNHILSLFNK